MFETGNSPEESVYGQASRPISTGRLNTLLRLHLIPPVHGVPIIEDNHVYDNSTTGKGGGIYWSEISPTVSNNIVADNISVQSGGGIYFYDSTPNLTNDTITGNSSDKGGGIYFYDSTPILTNNTVTWNSADNDGGGIYLDGSSLELTNNTTTGNSAIRGGGIFSFQTWQVTLNNTIFWSDDAPEGSEIWIGEGSFNINYSDIGGGWSSVYVDSVSTITAGLGMIDADPIFATFQGFDYLLRPGSPCIDSGHPEIEDGFDWPGWYPNGPRSDMGAYGGPGNVGWLPE